MRISDLWRPPGRWFSVVLATTAVALFGLGGAESKARADTEALPATSLSIAGQAFFINGEVTYKDRVAVQLETGGSANLEGLLLNARMINALFDDANEKTRANWTYPSGPAEAFDAARNTSEFVAMLPVYRERGLLMVTVGLQGGNPAAADAPGNGGRPSWKVSAFTADGALEPAWMDRLATVIEAADAIGMVVNVSLFYQRQEHLLSNEASARTAVDNVSDWLVERGYGNVLLTIQNEVGSELWRPGIWEPERAHELIERAQARHPELIVGTGMHDVLPTRQVVEASDFLAFSANTMTAEQTGEYIDALRALPEWDAQPKPILIIEDGPRPSTAELETVLERSVSFGYHDDGPSGGEWSNYHDGFQWVPVDWTLDTSAKQTFFGSVSRLTKPPADVADPGLVVSSFSDRSSPRPLDGETLTDAAYIFVAGAVGVTTTRFWLDDGDRSGPPVHVEDYAPWDLAGGDATAASPLDTGALGAGSHTITVELTLEAGGISVLHATFSIAP